MTSRENIQSAQIAYLYSEIASIISGGGGGVPTSSDLADVLINGNSAGSNGIDMNQQDITNGNVINVGSNSHSINLDGASATLTLTDNLGNINVITASGINVPNIDADNVLTTATTSNSTFYPTFLGATTGYNGCGVDTGLTYNPSTHTETFTDGSGNSTIINPTSITTGTLNYTTLNPPISADTLSSVLTAGNTATNSIILDNSGTGTNLISLLPNFSANNPHITLTDGTTTNTIDKNGYTTRNSVQNSTHFLNFSDASTTGIGSIQKTSGIECNPSTKTITATTFVGDLSGNATTATTASGATDITVTDSTATAGTFYPTFVNSAGTNKSVRIDTTGLTYSPSTDTLTATNFSGTATSATDITVTDSTAPVGTFYPTFVNNAGTNKTVRVDTTGLTYTPTSNSLSCAEFRPSITNINNSAVFNETGLSVSYTLTSNNTTINSNQITCSNATNTTTIIPASVTSPLFIGDLSGNATTATIATNIAGGLGGSIPYQSAVNTTALLANGTAGQVLTSAGTTLAPTWTTPAGGSTINITDTNTNATFFPTFVSASGSGQTLRADTSSTNALKYNPSSNLLFSSDTASSTTLSLRSNYSNTGSGSADLNLVSGNGSSNMSVNLSCNDALGDYTVLDMKANNANLFTGNPVGDSMEQTGVQLTNTADTYFATDTYATAPIYVSRVSTNGWTWGTGSAIGQYPNYTPIPALTSLMSLSTAGILTFGANTNGIQNRTTSTTITFSSNPLTLSGNNLSFRSYQINFTGTTNAVSSYSFSTMPINGDYTIAVYNGGSGNATFASTATYRFSGGVTFTIPTSRYAVIKVQQLSVNATTIFFLTGTLY
jgi:hypothetical protein